MSRRGASERCLEYRHRIQWLSENDEFMGGFKQTYRDGQ